MKTRQQTRQAKMVDRWKDDGVGLVKSTLVVKPDTKEIKTETKEK